MTPFSLFSFSAVSLLINTNNNNDQEVISKYLMSFKFRGGKNNNNEINVQIHRKLKNIEN